MSHAQGRLIQPSIPWAGFVFLGAIWTQVKNRPLAIEEERINFE